MNDPQWHIMRIMSLMLYHDHPDDISRAIAEGIRQHPNYPALYFQAAFASQEQWGGSMSMIEDIAQTAVRNTRAADGKSMYARIYWFLYSRPSMHAHVFEDSLMRWETMREGFEDLAGRYPDPWNLNAYAYFACRAGDRAAFESALTRIGERIDYAAWDYGTPGKGVYDACVNGTTFMGRTPGVKRMEDLPWPRRTLGFMLAGMERVGGVMAWVALFLAFGLGFALRAARRSPAMAWTIATLQAPLLVFVFNSGRSGNGLNGWALGGSLFLGALLAACGVLLASILVRDRIAAG